MSTKVKFKQIVFPNKPNAFIKGDGTFDTNNYLILDDNDKIPEENIPDSVILKAIYYEDFINADYTPKLGETIIIIDYIKVDNKNIPSFVIGDGTITLKDLSPSGDFSKYSERAKVADDLGGREETRVEQFTFQATAGDESVKDGLAVVKSIKGNTVVVNQLVNENGTLSLISGRKYYLNIQGVKSIITATSGQTIDVVTEDIVIDLTKMFGEGNEPATVKDFERLYPNLPTEYNAGSLLNLNADSIKSVGFNQWDEEWEVGRIDYNGNLVPGNDAICSKNYIKVLPDTNYFFNANGYTGYCVYFDKNYKNVYPNTAYLIPINGLKPILANCHYVKFYINKTSVYNNDICINLSHSGYRDGEYEPYKESIANLPIKKYFPDGMKSAGSVRDEIVWDESIKKYKAIQRIDTRAYQTGDEDLTNVRTDKTNTYYELETPIETIIDDYDLIDYEVSDFGTEKIIVDEPTTPIVADIQYGFNAVDEIRNHRFEINKLKKSIKHGVLTIGEYKFDGSTDVTIPIYDNEYTII